jgi:hypothetical protein
MMCDSSTGSWGIRVTDATRTSGGGVLSRSAPGITLQRHAFATSWLAEGGNENELMPRPLPRHADQRHAHRPSASQSQRTRP